MPRGIYNRKSKSKKKAKKKKAVKRHSMRTAKPLPKGTFMLEMRDSSRLLPDVPNFAGDDVASAPETRQPDDVSLLASQLMDLMTQQNALIRDQNSVMQNIGRILEHRR